MKYLIILLLLTLTWIDNSGGLAFTRVERRSNGPVNYTGYLPIADVTQTIATYIDSLPQPGDTYCYRVFAYIDTLVSDYSNEACGTVPISEPTPPPICRKWHPRKIGVCSKF